MEPRRVTARCRQRLQSTLAFGVSGGRRTTMCDGTMFRALDRSESRSARGRTAPVAAVT